MDDGLDFRWSAVSRQIRAGSAGVGTTRPAAAVTAAPAKGVLSRLRQEAAASLDIPTLMSSCPAR